MKKKFLVGLAVITPIFTTLVNSNNTNATKVITGGIYRYTITNYTVSPETSSTGTSSIGTSFPKELITGARSFDKVLNGVNITGTTYNEFSGSQSTNSVKVSTNITCSDSFRCTLYSNASASISGTLHSGTAITGTCSVTSATATSLQHTCSLVGTNYDYPETFSLTIGTTSVNDGVVAISDGYPAAQAPGSIYLSSVSISVDSSQDMSSALLQQQIQQNQTIINQNQQQIEQDAQDRTDVQNASDSASDNAENAQTSVENTTTSLLDAMSAILTAFNTPATNCQIPADLGHGMDLGTLDFCTGKPAQLTPIINTVCAMVMCIPIYMVARSLIHRFIDLMVYAQGGMKGAS